MKNGIARSSLLTLALIAAVIAGASTWSCSSSAKKKPRALGSVQGIERNLPTILRNTIGSETQIRGGEPVLVSGFGLVVGLNGTGSADVPASVRAWMENYMTQMRVGTTLGGELAKLSPGELIDDPNTAIVLVRAVIEPGAPAGTRFDVRVDAFPGTSTTSLEGGRLYTTELHRGVMRPGMPDTAPMARANGDIFINPFVDPAEAATGQTVALGGRVLAGGVVIEPFTLAMFLDSPSHSRARAITSAINSRFPRNRGEPETALGRSDELVEINIPSEFRDRAREFVQLIRATRIDQTYPQEWAVRYSRALVEQPELAEDLSWCLRALGPVAIPHLRDLYTYTEVAPRMAAIQAGAYLGDATTRPYLEELALKGPPASRTDAMGLLAQLGPDPRINRFFRDQLFSSDVELRIAAYEGLVQRADPIIERMNIEDKFSLDLVPGGEPMIYITQQDEAKIVLFGAPIALNDPLFVSVWDDRLMLDRQSQLGSKVRVFYRDYRSELATTEAVNPNVLDLIKYMAHKTTPEEPAPGLDFNYSEVIGALYEITSARATAASFLPQRDRLALELLRSVQREFETDRPELEGEETLEAWEELPDMDEVRDIIERTRKGTGKRQYVVPIQQPVDNKKN